MMVTCEACGQTYDDVYRLTYCPHERFEMRTRVYNGACFLGIARSVEELRRLIGDTAIEQGVEAIKKDQARQGLPFFKIPGIFE